MLSFLTPKRILLALAVFAAVGAGCLAYAYFIEPFRLITVRSDVPVLNSDASINGLRIVAISDIHGGSRGVTPEKIREVVARANAEKPDLIVLLGDYVSESMTDRDQLLMPVAEVCQNLRGLEARLGVYAVLGNHDGWHDDNEIRKGLESAGITVLENEMRVIDRGEGVKFRLLGLKDHLKLDSWRRFPGDVAQAVASTERVGKVIVLEHSPDILEVLAYHKSLGDDFGIMLAGHSHGGQVWFPILGRPIVPIVNGQKYAYGHVRDRGLDMYVTAGVGTSLLPIRFMVPPEIAVLTITPETKSP